MTALRYVIVAVISLSLGFTAHNFLDEPDHEPELNGQSAALERLSNENASLRQRIEELERARARMRMPAFHSGEESSSETAVPTSQPAQSRPVAGSSSRPSAGKGNDKPTRASAERLLAGVKAAIDSGDEDALAGMLKDLVAHGDFLVSDFIEMLEGADSLFAKEKLAALLGEIGDKQALSTLQDLLKNEENDAVRTAAVKALGQIADPSSVALLSDEFSRTSTSPMPASLAASSLGSIATPEAVSALQVEIREGANPMVRSFALRALAEQGNPQLTPFFFEQAGRRDASERYRVAALTAIGRTGNKEAVWQLEKVAFSKEVSTAEQEAAKRAINRISGRKVY